MVFYCNYSFYCLLYNGYVFNWGGFAGTIIAIGIAVFYIVRTNVVHKKRNDKQGKKDEFADKETLNGENIVLKCNSSIISVVGSVSKLYFSTILNLIKEDRKKMKSVMKKIEDIEQVFKRIKI